MNSEKIDRVNDPPNVGLSELEQRLEGKGWLRRQLIMTLEGLKFWKFGAKECAVWTASSNVTLLQVGAITWFAASIKKALLFAKAFVVAFVGIVVN